MFELSHGEAKIEAAAITSGMSHGGVTNHFRRRFEPPMTGEARDHIMLEAAT